jgi:hypothetical protein
MIKGGRRHWGRHEGDVGLSYSLSDLLPLDLIFAGLGTSLY